MSADTFHQSPPPAPGAELKMYQALTLIWALKMFQHLLTWSCIVLFKKWKKILLSLLQSLVYIWCGWWLVFYWGYAVLVSLPFCLHFILFWSKQVAVKKKKNATFLFLCSCTTCWWMAAMQQWLLRYRPFVQFVKWQKRFRSLKSQIGFRSFTSSTLKSKHQNSNARAKCVRAVFQTLLTVGKLDWITLRMYWTGHTFCL